MPTKVETPPRVKTAREVVDEYDNLLTNQLSRYSPGATGIEFKKTYQAMDIHRVHTVPLRRPTPFLERGVPPQ